MAAKVNRRRANQILVSMLVTFSLLRIYLHLFPSTNLDVAGFNIHHLFTGLILITIGAIPLIVFEGDSRLLDFSAILFGGGLSLALDEWVYLIVTDGSDTSYLAPESLWGAAIMIGLTSAYILILVRRQNRQE